MEHIEIADSRLIDKAVTQAIANVSLENEKDSLANIDKLQIIERIIGDKEYGKLGGLSYTKNRSFKK